MTGNGQKPPIWVLSAANEETVTRLRGVLSKILERVCPPWLASQREDLVQTACIKVMALLNDGERNRRLETSYLWKLAHSQVVDEIRRLARQREISLEAMPVDDRPASGAGPERQVQGFQIGKAVLA